MSFQIFHASSSLGISILNPLHLCSDTKQFVKPKTVAPTPGGRDFPNQRYMCDRNTKTRYLLWCFYAAFKIFTIVVGVSS